MIPKLVVHAVSGDDDVAMRVDKRMYPGAFTASSLDNLLDRLRERVKSSGTKISVLRLNSHGFQGGFDFGSDTVGHWNIEQLRIFFKGLRALLTDDALVEIDSCLVAGGKYGPKIAAKISGELPGITVRISPDVQEAGSNLIGRVYTYRDGKRVAETYEGCSVDSLYGGVFWKWKGGPP